MTAPADTPDPTLPTAAAVARRAALQQLRGAILAVDADHVLEQIVEEVAVALGAPIVLVSLGLERVELLRASRGLEADLLASRTLDTSMPLWRIAAEVGMISDTAMQPIAADVVERLGVVSYLGASIYLGGELVGALSVIDRVSRTFSVEQRTLVAEAAGRAAERLRELGNENPASESLLDRAVRPQFAELRNRMQPLLTAVSAMETALAELQATHRVAEYVAANPDEPATSVPLAAAAAALRELESCIVDVGKGTERVHRAVLALESASLVAGSMCAASEVVEAASTLAHHYTKLIGGVTWSEDKGAALAAPMSVAVNLVAAALSGLASDIRRARGRRGITGRVQRTDAAVEIRLEAPDLDATRLTINASALARLIDDVALLAVRHDASAIELVFARSKDIGRAHSILVTNE